MILLISCCQTLGLFLFFNYYKYFSDEHSWYEYSRVFLRISVQKWKYLGKEWTFTGSCTNHLMQWLYNLYFHYSVNVHFTPPSFLKSWQFDMLLLFSFLSTSHFFTGKQTLVSPPLWSVHIFCPLFFHDVCLHLRLSKKLCHAHVCL